jgi:hypothetical protein
MVAMSFPAEENQRPRRSSIAPPMKEKIPTPTPKEKLTQKTGFCEDSVDVFTK